MTNSRNRIDRSTSNKDRDLTSDVKDPLAIAFEEYLQRSEAGEPIDREEFLS